MCSTTVSPFRRLSAAMKDGSAAEHSAAEGTTFISELFAGRVTAAGYSNYLLRLRVVYAALEDAIRASRHDPMVAAVYDPALERLPAIDADLEFWLAGASRELHSPAAAAYSERVRDLAWGGSLVAHHYTRYLGDLSGGRAMGKVLDRTFELGGRGLAFYEFPMRPKPYKDDYRARLDALCPDADATDRIVGEVKVAFGLNHALLDELAA
jgi:heme oxygenase